MFFAVEIGSTPVTRYRAGGGKRRGRRTIEPGILLLLRHPGGELGVVHHPHGDRHEGVVLAAQFRALAVEAAFTGRLEPGVVEPARHGVDLDPEGGHGEGVDDVGARHQHVHHLVHRHHHLVVDGEKPRLVGLEILVLDQQRVELEVAVVWVVVAPIPLLAGGLHGQVRLRRIELKEQEAEGRHRDRQQDDDGNDGPDHLDQRVVGRARRSRVGAAIEPDHYDHEQR
jgi:hypothetical protein